MRFKLLSVILSVLVIAKATQIQFEDNGDSDIPLLETIEADEDDSITVSTTTEDKEGPGTIVSTTTEDKEGPSTIVSTTTEDKESSSTTVSTTTEPTKGSENYPISVPNKDGKAPCIFSKMNITLRVTYEKMNNKNGTVSLLVPNNTETDGDCGETESTMILSWSVSTVFGNQYIRTLYDVYADENKLTFHFKKNGTIFSVDKIDMDIILDEDNFPLAKEKRLQRTTRENLNLFAASANNSKYVCNEETVVLMEDGGIELSLKDVDLIAFNEDTDITSRSEVNCNQTEASGSTEASVSTEATESADVGAIVGGIIGALAIVGIIGFIIWRRRKNSYAHSEVP